MFEIAFYLSVTGLLLCFLHQIETKQSAAHNRRKCIPEITVAWSHELSSAPFASTPLISDIDLDGELDIAVTSFAGDVHVVKSKDGQYRRGSHWPLRLLHSSIHASPLQYDVDHDGILDLLVCASDGQLIAVDVDGQFLSMHQVSPLAVLQDWFKHQLSAGQESIHDFILDDPSHAKEGVSYIYLDPHVLATPVIDDMNQDGIVEELVLPVSYYLDIDDYSNSDHGSLPDNIGINDTSNYLVSALVYLNLTSMQPYLTVHLDLTKRTAEFPAYLLASPTVVDVDADQSGLETFIGTSAGRLHLVDVRGKAVAPYPIPLGIVQSQVVVDDVDGNDELEVIVQEAGGNVACYGAQSGRRLWETDVSGSVPLGIKLADITGDMGLEVIVATDDGHVWVLNGKTGVVVEGWPVKVSAQLNSSPLLTQLYGLDMTLIVNLGSDGTLHFISADRSCQYHVTIGETSLVSLVSHDLLPTVSGAELLVATSDGTLFCLTSGNSTETLMAENQPNVKSTSWPAEYRTHNDFMYSSQRFIIIDNPSQSEYNSYTFSVDFNIVDNTVSPSLPYTCQVMVGGLTLHSFLIQETGYYSLSVPSPRKPAVGHLVVECRSKHGRVMRDMVIVRFYRTFLTDLQWLLVGPSLAMSILLLFLHGFPSADILPVTVQCKHR